MTNDDRVHVSSTANGKGSILKDSKIGAVVGGLVTAICLYLADAVGQFDVTPLPDFLEPAATGVIATVAMWFTTKAAPRR